MEIRNVGKCPEDMHPYEWYNSLSPEDRYWALYHEGIGVWMHGGSDTPTVESCTAMVGTPELTDRELRLLLICKSVDRDIRYDSKYLTKIVPWRSSAKSIQKMLDHILPWYNERLRENRLREEAQLARFDNPELKKPDPKVHEDYNPRNCLVYFLAGGEFIKIGYSKDPTRRVGELSNSSPVELELLATIPGGHNKERALHERFDKHRRHGEWFARDQEILSYIREISSNV